MLISIPTQSSRILPQILRLSSLLPSLTFPFPFLYLIPPPPLPSLSFFQDVIGMLDAYGLGKEDLMETMKDMQFLVDNNNTPPSYDMLLYDTHTHTLSYRTPSHGDHERHAVPGR